MNRSVRFEQDWILVRGLSRHSVCFHAVFGCSAPRLFVCVVRPSNPNPLTSKTGATKFNRRKSLTINPVGIKKILLQFLQSAELNESIDRHINTVILAEHFHNT